MPSVLTHYFFINDCLNENYPFLENEKDIAILGAQGTDPFYFYGGLFKRSNKEEVYSFASLIHNSNPFELFNFFIQEANKIDKEHRDYIYSYLFGLLNHYVLDRNTHPYVFYFSGIQEGFLKKHQKFETNIDVLLRRFYNDYTTPYKAVKTNDIDLGLISNIYYNYSNAHNLDLEEDTFEIARNDMYKIQKVLYSKSGLKKWFFKTFFKNQNPDNLSMPKRVEDNIDYLNLNKNLWQHPARNFKLNYSFLNLIEFAKKDFEKGAKILLKAYNNLDYEKDLKKFINNINHNGLDLDEKMLYENPVY